jgi:hypothetical protein
MATRTRATRHTPRITDPKPRRLASAQRMREIALQSPPQHIWLLFPSGKREQLVANLQHTLDVARSMGYSGSPRWNGERAAWVVELHDRDNNRRHTQWIGPSRP